MSINLTDPVFHSKDAARAYFERLHWPDGPVCPHCGVVNEATVLEGEAHRSGLYKCRACEKQFSVTVGTVMESSHVPLHKWALAFRLMAGSKKGVSAHQLMRELGLGSYRTAWFLAHRVREAMADHDPEPLGGKGKTRTHYKRDRFVLTAPAVQKVATSIHNAGLSLVLFLSNNKLTPPLPPPGRTHLHKTKLARKKRRKQN